MIKKKIRNHRTIYMYLRCTGYSKNKCHISTHFEDFRGVFELTNNSIGQPGSYCFVYKYIFGDIDWSFDWNKQENSDNRLCHFPSGILPRAAVTFRSIYFTFPPQYEKIQGMYLWKIYTTKNNKLFHPNYSMVSKYTYKNCLVIGKFF